MPQAEHLRLRDLKSFGMLDSGAEPAFDRLTELATELFDCPIALVSLVDETRLWFKSARGLSATEIPREISFCAHAIDGDPHSIMVVEDATRDARFSGNPLVTGAPDIRFYAGATLTTSEGCNLGTLCVIDTKARARPSERELSRLKTLARIVVDELELRRANRLAVNRRRLLEMAGTIAHVGTWRYSIFDGEITWSDEVYRIHGVTPQTYDPALMNAIGFYHPDDQPLVTRAMDKAIAEKTGFDFQLRLIRESGEIRHVVSKGICEIDAGGDVAAIIGVFQDVTDSVRALHAIEQSEARHRHVTDTAPDIITESRLDGTLTFVSPAAFAVTGYAPEDLVGRSAFSLMSEEGAAAMKAMCNAVIQSKGAIKPWPIEFKATAKDGRELWLESRTTPFFDPESGRPTGLTDVLRDITSRKVLEQQLVEARRTAEKAAAVKADFLTNMSHELRTPLTAVLGFSRLVAEQPELTGETRQFADRVLTAGKALLATVNDILDFSKLEAGQVDIRAQATAPLPILRETLELMEEMADQKGIELALRAEHLPQELVFDADRLRQILLNLVGNAVKFTDRGAVRLVARYEGSALNVRVEDSGPGIAPDRLGELFQRFSQIDGSMTRRHGGTGLGLAICKGLVEAMQGEIGVESKQGLGSCFWFSIPMALAGERADGTVPADTAAKASLAGCRVLIADDNTVNRKLVRAMLRPHGVELTEAKDGVEAAELCRKRPFDVLLLDLRMPVMGGVEAAEIIRSGSGPNAATPILSFSADASIACDPELFDDVVLKPVSINDLLAALRRATADMTGGIHAAA